MLREGGADPNALNAYGLSALHWASSQDDILMMETLIECGAAVDQQSKDGSTALHAACRDECEAAVAMLLRCPTTLL